MISSRTSSLRPLEELVIPRPHRPETVLTLANAVTDRLETIQSFELPPSVKGYFERVLDAVAERRAWAFWVQSEYGGGKTHFISALTALLAHSPAGDDLDAKVWEAVNDADIRSRAHQFIAHRTLTVAISCKGIMPIDGHLSKALLNLLMDGISDTLRARGLEQSVPVTADDELVGHFLSRPDDFRTSVDAWCSRHLGASVTELSETEGPEKAAAAYRRYYREVAGADPEIDRSVVDWLSSLCRRLEGAGFDGLLVVIDEFATLQNLATTTADIAAYEDVLEALGWLVPERLRQRDDSDFGIYTIVASQRGNPVKLDERYTLLPLLAKDAKRDYEIIVSRRVRELARDRLPEIDQYYHNHKLSHQTYATMTIERFREVFPFQPRVFDAIWDITASGGDVAAARFGIAAVWDTLQEPRILDADRLLTVSDLLQSKQFQNDLATSPTYQSFYGAYQAARESARSLGVGSEDLDLAQRVLDALFVDFLASHRSPRWLSTLDIAEAVLATSSMITVPPADQVLRILGRLRELRQVSFETAKGARFEPEAGGGPLPTEVLNKIKDSIDNSDPSLAATWGELLRTTSPSIGLWSELKGLDLPRNQRVYHNRINYSGVVELRQAFGRESRLAELGHSSGRHFQVIVLDRPVAVAPDDIADPRVAVVIPGPMTAEEIDLCKTYVACQRIRQNITLLNRPDGAALDSFAQQMSRDAAQKLITRQSQAYRRGQIVSRTAVAFNADTTFNGMAWLPAIESIVDRLLGAAYDRLDEIVRPHRFKASSRLDPNTDSGKIFAGLIAGSTQPADVGAATNFGLALGLCQEMSPTVLALDQDHFPISMILQALVAAGKDGDTTEQFYEKLCAMPYGVPQEIVTLWLLACVRAATIGTDKRHIEIQLQKNAKARRKDGTRLPSGLITLLNVKDLDWSSSLRGDFLAIQVSEEVSFGEVVEYARVFDPTLKVPTVPDALLSEEERLQQVIATTRSTAVRTKHMLDSLARTMDQPLPPGATAKLDSLLKALDLENGYQRQQLLAQVQPIFRSVRDLGQAWTDVQSWGHLAEHAADLTSLNQILREMVNRLSSRPGRYRAIVDKARTEVLPRLVLVDLLASPSSIESVLDAARAVRDAYESEYRIHHRNYCTTVERLQEKLDNIDRQATTLNQLNKLKCAGSVTLPDPHAGAAALRQRLRLCPVPTRADVSLAGLSCRQHGCSLPALDPLAEPPTDDVRHLARLLDQAIRQRVNTVKARAISKILEDSHEPIIGAFLAAIQADQFDGLVKVLDDRLIALIDRVLEDAGIRVIPNNAIARVVERFGTIQRGQIGDVTAALRDELERAFAEQEMAHPDAIIQLQLALGE